MTINVQFIHVSFVHPWSKIFNIFWPCFCYGLLQRSEIPQKLTFKMLCSATATSPVCDKWNLRAGLIFMKTSRRYAFFPLWDWALVTWLVWDFIGCLSGTCYTLKMYSKHVSNGDFFLVCIFILTISVARCHHIEPMFNSMENQYLRHVESNQVREK